MFPSGLLSRISLLLGVAVVVTACTSASDWVSPEAGTLVTRIGKDGSKQFVYRIPPRALRENLSGSLEERQSRNGHANDGGFNGRVMNPEESGVGRNKQGMERFLSEQTARKLVSTGYCRTDKFITIQINTDPMDTYLQGECQESATPEDRKKFPEVSPR